MSVILDAIKFNHNTGSHTTDALTIRKNRYEDISVPEWQNGISIKPEDSPAAYAILQTTGNTITIYARFHTTGATLSTAEIRAIDPALLRGYWGWLMRVIYFFRRFVYGNILGEVKAKGVTFNITGHTGFTSFELTRPQIARAGVGIYNIEWQWQYRSGGSRRWHNMQLSKHRIYVILETPKESWNQIPGSDHLPWIDVLDYSCAWARGAKTKDHAATGITENVFALGNSVIEYDCPNFGDTHYCYATNFDCTKFIERMKGGTGNGQYVNCTDIATVVTTFSNILGCELWNSKMQGPWGTGFQLNPILAIGGSVWQTACGWGAFSYHEVAWKNNCDVNDELFDACLQVDGDSDPTAAPHVPLLPTNIKFGDCNGALLYRQRLSPAITTGCTDCVPDPVHKKRRTLK
jgi:hypothetical protein